MMNLNHAYVKGGKITLDNIEFYKNSGYLIAPGLVSEKEIAELKKETAEIFRGNRGVVEGLVAVKPDESDDDVLKKYLAIHFPHKLSPVIKDYLFHQSITNILTHIISPNVKCMQSMLFVKAPDKAGQSWHQDEYFIPTRDRSLCGVWIAIDDASINNGCLWIVPGSNHPGCIRPRVANHSDEYTDLDTVDVSAYDLIVPVEVKRGSVVFFNGYTLHSSLRNKTADCFRTALVNHYMSAESMLPWDQDGKLMLTDDLRDIILITGTDPYGYKGTTDDNKPYLRAEIKG
jgi:phytanoyl-CoA hydroxylase